MSILGFNGAELHDAHAEKMLLAGIMKAADETVAGLKVMGFTGPMLYYDSSRKLYDLLMFLFNGGTASPMLGAAFDELVRRKWWLDNFPDAKRLAQYLADVYTVESWMSDMMKWADMRYPDTSFHAWAALAAAAKVMHLSARRQTYHAAVEAIKEAVDPAGDAAWLHMKIDELEGG